MLITVENYLPQGSEDEERGEKMEDAEQEERSRVKITPQRLLAISLPI